MPNTLHALLVLVFAILPGIPGNTIYKKVAGTNWREEEWKTIVRILGISLSGLITYILVGSLFNAPLPTYISPATFVNFTVERTPLVQMSIAFLGHLIAALIVGYIGASVTKSLDRWTRISEFADSWHDFVSVHANNHWIVVSIKGGAAYTGYIQKADTNIEAKERDIILAEPAVYVQDQKRYRALPYNYLFLPGKIIDSVAIVSDQSDKRMTKIHEYLFADTTPAGD